MEHLPVQGIATVLAAILATSGLAFLAWPAAAKARLRLSRLRPTLRLPSFSSAVALPAASVIPDRLSRDAQWDRATGVVTQAIARVEAVHELQSAAEQQLDAATYALQRLFAELSGVMTLPAGVASADPVAQQVVHPFAAAPPRREAEAIAA